MITNYLPEVIAGVLLTRHGEVHRRLNSQRTACGQTFLPNGAADVSTTQAVVHKLRLCHTCYPAHGPGGRRP